MFRQTILAAALCLPFTALNAQTFAQDLTARLSDQIVSLQGVGADNRPAGNVLVMRLYASGAAHIPGLDPATNWALWRITDGGAFCATTALQARDGTLSPIRDEECFALDIEGANIRLSFVSSTGGTQAFEGILRPF